jgi:hypothetical protein
LERLSPVYRDEKSAADAMFFSPEQIAVLADLVRAARD